MEASTLPKKSIREGQAEICLTTDKVFYNPVQEFNRDLSIAVLTVFTEEYKAEKFAELEKKKSKVGNEGNCNNEVRKFFFNTQLFMMT